MKAEIKLVGDKLRVRCVYGTLLVERFRSVPGRSFDRESKEWVFPAAPDVVSMLSDILGLLPWQLPEDVRLVGRQSETPLAPPDLRLIDGHHFLVPPYQHQRVNLARLMEKERWLISDEMGLGKTAVIVNRLLRREPGPVLIVCPKSVMSVWKEQLMLHGRMPSVVRGKHEKDDVEQARCDYRPLITNYESVLYHWGTYDFTWPYLVLDEVHRLKNFTSQTSKLVRRLSERATYVYALSGTPAPNGLEDWLGVISAVDPNLLPCNTKTGFYARYCVREEVGGVWRVTGYRNVAELHGYVQRICSRFTKRECLDLPEKVFSRRSVTLAGEQARVYREIKKEAVARLNELGSTLTVRNILTESLRLLQIVGGFVPDDSGTVHSLPDKAKLEALEDVLDEAGDRQAVIWCAFKEEVRFLDKWLFDHYGSAPAVLTGDVCAEGRARNVQAFASGESRFFLGTSAGGEGINGLQCADLEVFYSRTFNLKDYLQQQDRLHRIGQKRTVNVVNLVADGTVDQRVDDSLERKAELQNLLLLKPEELF